MKREFNVDILRLLSILVVLLAHYELVSSLYLKGTQGVVLFFFISGYCILLTAYRKESFQDFWKARFLRLLPTFFLCATIVVLVKRLFKTVRPDRLGSIADFFYSTICIPSLDIPCIMKNFVLKQDDYSFVDGAYWSLLVEFRYYFLFSLLWFVCKLRKSSIFLLLAFSYLSLYTQVAYTNRINDIFLYLVFFCFGMSYFEYSHKSKKVGLLGLILSLGSFLFFSWFGVKQVSFSLNSSTFGGYLACFFIFVLLMKVLKSNGHRSYPKITYLAILSYPVYLLHQDLGYIAIKLFVERGLNSTGAAIITILGITGIAHVVNILATKSLSFFVQSQH